MKNYMLFDFDGVIVDSLGAAMEVKKLMCPATTEEAYLKGFEGNINDWKNSETIHTAECRHDTNFFEEYIPRLMKANLTSGIKEAVAELSKRYALIIISSTISAPIKELLEKHNLLQYFTEVMGNDIHKSKIEKMKMVFEKYKTNAKECVFITDTLGDIREATKMDVPAIAVDWGFHTEETLALGEPFAIVSDTTELIEAISTYFSLKPL